MDVHQLPQHFYELFEVAIELAAQQDLGRKALVTGQGDAGKLNGPRWPKNHPILGA
jgi:hypothetical protein